MLIFVVPMLHSLARALLNTASRSSCIPHVSLHSTLSLSFFFSLSSDAMFSCARALSSTRLSPCIPHLYFIPTAGLLAVQLPPITALTQLEDETRRSFPSLSVRLQCRAACVTLSLFPLLVCLQAAYSWCVFLFCCRARRVPYQNLPSVTAKPLTFLQACRR